MAKTYTITVGWETGLAGGDGEETFALADLGYTDEEWDALSKLAQDRFVDGIAETEFWNRGFGYWGEVKRG